MDSHEPVSLEDARRRTDAAIVARQGSGAFRALVLKGFGARCAISHCDAPEALEAAHVTPYLGEHTNKLENALLFRADLHTLFDRQLLRIHAATLTVQLAPALQGSSYANLEGRSVRLASGVSPDTLRSQLRQRHRALNTV